MKQTCSAVQCTAATTGPQTLCGVELHGVSQGGKDEGKTCLVSHAGQVS